MNTSATPIPGTAEQPGAFNVKRQLWRLPVGTMFEDYSGRQRFEKVAEIINARGELRHVIQCLASPFKEGQIGQVCSAFFTTPGTILFREGSLQVFIQDDQTRINLGGYSFLCDQVVNGIAINPRLPGNFSSTANEARPARHRVWLYVPFIEICHGDNPVFVAHWKGNTRYDVRCLDGGAWDRPTCWGMFSTMEETIDCAGRGPSWRAA